MFNPKNKFNTLYTKLNFALSFHVTNAQTVILKAAFLTFKITFSDLILKNLFPLNTCASVRLNLS